MDRQSGLVFIFILPFSVYQWSAYMSPSSCLLFLSVFCCHAPTSLTWSERIRTRFLPRGNLYTLPQALLPPPSFPCRTLPGCGMTTTQHNRDLAQRPPYHTVDFKTLARTNPAFKQLWQSASGKLDFQDPATTKTLSRALLQSDFGLQLDVPDDRLCPPIPNRWNYVSWMQGLIDSTSPTYSSSYDSERQVVGLDIGTGASAIYTMLCLRSRPNWTMCATDIDKHSFDSAARNLAINNLMTRTRLFQSTASAPLIPWQALATEKLDFTICNPPFFADDAEMRASLQGDSKTWKPNAVCTGAHVEMVCPGGDLGFVTRLVQESLVLREKVTWYTSMLGKLDSAKAILSLLKHHGITNWAVGVIDPGTATKRWTVAWSFTAWRPRNVCFPPISSMASPLPARLRQCPFMMANRSKRRSPAP